MSDRAKVAAKLPEASQAPSLANQTQSTYSPLGRKHCPQRTLGNQGIERLLQAKRVFGHTGGAGSDLASRINSQRENGRPLPESSRSFFEPRFGVDFAHVRVHTGQEADSLNRVLNARAFTAGADIFFRSREYNPNSSEGRTLLAHELTHVVQQNSAVQRQNFTEVVPANHPSEREADYIAGRIVAAQEGTGRYPLGSQIHSRAASGQLHRYALEGVNPVALEEFRELLVAYESAAATAEETAAINAAIVEAETAIATATEAAAVEATLIAGTETAAGATVAEVVDDVTGIGVADDAAIPFTVLALVGLGIGAVAAGVVVAYYWDEARELVLKVIRLIQKLLARLASPALESAPEEDEEEKPCCCCAEDVRIENIEVFHRSPEYGHKFDAFYYVSYKGTPPLLNDCMLEWWERTNRAYTPTMKANQWNNMTQDPQTAGSFAKSWGSRQRECNSSEVAPPDHDEPVASVWEEARTLEFRIKVISAPGCECALPEKCLTARQILVPPPEKKPMEVPPPVFEVPNPVDSC